MDFDKIKNAAKNTIKIVSDKVEETFSHPENEDIPKKQATPIDDFDDFTLDDDPLGTTQRFDMKDALNRFRKHKEEIEDKISDLVSESDNAQAITSEFIENSFSDLEKGITSSISDIDEDISNLSLHYSQEITKINNDISSLSEKIASSAIHSEKTHSALSELSENLENAVMNINKKLSDISASLSGVNRINDSIFDLKNSQVNTKNVLGDLDTAFSVLKKKMTAGITILSVITAVVAVLEVINLLS